MNLIIKLVLGILVGICIGLYAPVSVLQIFITFKEFFAQFLGFMIPLLIVCFIGEGIAALDFKAGKLLGMTTFLSYLSTICAGFFSAYVALKFIPSLDLEIGSIEKNILPLPFVKIAFPPFMDVMSSLVFAFVFGIGAAKTKSVHINKILTESKNIIEWVILSIIIPVLPFYIGCLFIEIAAEGQVSKVLQSFGYVLVCVVTLHWVWIFCLYAVAGALKKQNPFFLIQNMMKAYMTAIGTMSSAATIPVTLQQTLKNGVKGEIAQFVIPLCATIHLAGSTITLTVGSIAVNYLINHTILSWEVLAPFIFLLGVTMVAAPGVPGGAVMAALGLLSSVLGFSEEALALMIALYAAQDSFGTACNIAGDGALAIVVDYMNVSEKEAPVLL